MKDTESNTSNVVSLFKDKTPVASAITQEEINEYFTLINQCENYYDLISQEDRDVLCKMLMSFSKSMIQDCYDRLKELNK